MPTAVVISIAHQLALRPELFLRYRWRSRIWRHHLWLIRQRLETRSFTSTDSATLVDYLALRGNEFPSRKDLLGAAVHWCADCHVELPREKKLNQMVGAATRRFFHALYEEVFARVAPEARDRMQACIAPSASGSQSYDWMKATPGKLGIKTILEEIKKLEHIRSFQADARRIFRSTSPKILRQLRERARAEDAAEMRRHRPAVRVALLAALLDWREKETTDGVARILLELVRRVDKKTDHELEKQVARDIKKVFGKDRRLYRIAVVATENPDATVRQVVFPAVGEDVLRRLVEEAAQAAASYEIVHSRVAQRKYRTHYRRMVKRVLDVLTFRCNNPAQRPLLDGLALVHRYLDTKHTHYPETEQIPEQLLAGKQREVVFEKGDDGKERAAKHPFELLVLRRLEQALKCKKLWIEGAYRFRNPDEDLPPAWPQTRLEHYRQHEFPLEAGAFLKPVRAEMNEALEDFHRFLGRTDRGVHLQHPRGGERGEFHVPKTPHIGAWDQNLMTERNPHYPERGVMAYWHVETNATCVYAHLHSISSSQVAAMIRGLVQHATDMRLESNFVDSHGQSEVAFGVCRFIGVELLPRFRRLKHEKLYLPDKEVLQRFPRFAGVLARPMQPIRWDLIEQQYDEMVRHVVALLDGTGPVESILRRLTTYNRTHPTYKAFAELGKADKTAFLCRVLGRPELRQEINEGLNVVENWNSCNDFICFGRRSELHTNDPETQELVILSLHLLQNALVLANTMMLESVLRDERLLARMAPEDRRALTPLFTLNVNPYGDFNLDLNRPSFLKAAA